MKYPKQQFEVLKQVLTILGKHFDLTAAHESNLHFTVYAQFSEGLTHNTFYIDWYNNIARLHQIKDNLSGWSKLINIDFPFELYPEGCHDSHIETAVKAALKQIL